jgi:hypothetical protein
MRRDKRKLHEITESSLDEIKNILMSKNISISENIHQNNQEIIIHLIDKQKNIIGKINGGVGEFKVMEKDEDFETNAFSISWLEIQDNYKGYNLGTFLIIYCIYLCKTHFNDIDYIVLDDDSDGLEEDKNIYRKLGFTYQETKEIPLENGEIITVKSSPEMQLKITDFSNNMFIEHLNKIKMKIQNLVKSKGGKRKTKRYMKQTKNRKTRTKRR